ncbi:MAG: hypothetical protein ACJAVI_005384 [Candidatus Azotimanducaceae bacterium]|jgi:hypothetical protein
MNALVLVKNEALIPAAAREHIDVESAYDGHLLSCCWLHQ